MVQHLKMVLDLSRTDTAAVDGVFYCAKYAGAVFKRQGFGNLIITSSISAHIVNVPVDQPVRSTTSTYSITLTLTGVQCYQSSCEPSW